MPKQNEHLFIPDHGKSVRCALIHLLITYKYEVSTYLSGVIYPDKDYYTKVQLTDCSDKRTL
jgi:hypothetical protein